MKLEVGQVWEDERGTHREILAIRSGRVAYLYYDLDVDYEYIEADCRGISMFERAYAYKLIGTASKECDTLETEPTPKPETNVVCFNSRRTWRSTKERIMRP